MDKTKPHTYPPEWIKQEEKLLKALHTCIDTDMYDLTVKISEDVQLRSVYFSNGNRRVNIEIFGQCFEIYSQNDSEGIDVIERRVLHAHRNLIGAKYHQLKALIGH